jgi:hypothetical protein
MPGGADGAAAASASGGALASLDDGFLDEDQLPGGGAGYAAAYAKLANAAAPERPVLADIPDTSQYAASSLASFLQRVGSGA